MNLNDTEIQNLNRKKICEFIMKHIQFNKFTELLIRQGFQKLFIDLNKKCNHNINYIKILNNIKTDTDLIYRAGYGIEDENKKQQIIEKEQIDTANRLYSNKLIKSFDNFTIFIQNKTIVNMMNCFLSRYYQIIDFNKLKSDNIILHKLTAREYLSAYIISGFPEIILGYDKTKLLEESNNLEYEQGIYKASNDLIRIFNIVFEIINKIQQIKSLIEFKNLYTKEHYKKLLKTRQELLRTFNRQFCIYTNLFIMWKHKDLLCKIDDGLQEWVKYENSKQKIEQSKIYSEEQQNASMTVLNTHQNKIINILKKISPTIDFNTFLPNYYELTKNIKKTMELASIDLLQESLDNKDYSLLKNNLESIKTGILNIKNDPKFVEQLETNFDISFIMHMVENQAYSGEIFMGHITYLVTILKNLQAPFRDTSTETEWKEIQELMEHNSFSKTVAICLKFISKIILQIQKDIQRIKFLTEIEK